MPACWLALSLSACCSRCLPASCKAAISLKFATRWSCGMRSLSGNLHTTDGTSAEASRRLSNVLLDSSKGFQHIHPNNAPAMGFEAADEVAVKFLNWQIISRQTSALGSSESGRYPRILIVCKAAGAWSARQGSQGSSKFEYHAS